MNDLKFTQDSNLGFVSNKVLCGEEGVVTFAVKMQDNKTHTALVQQSINGEDWQNIGTASFTEYIELNIEGLRANIQYARIAILDEAQPLKGLYV